jgi:hypothetical protein
MKPTRRNAIAISCIFMTALMLYLTKPWFTSLEGELSLGWFPLKQMTDTYGDVAQGSADGPHFGRAYTIGATKPDGEVNIIYLANPVGRVFGNSSRPAGRVLQGCEVGDAIRIRGITYSTIGPSLSGSRIPRGYRIMMLQSVEKLNSTWEVIQIGRRFLDERGYTTGRILSSILEEREPNFYWDYALKFERPDIQGLRSCWVIRFEQAERPGHWFEVWVDASEYLVIGGMQCR